MMTHYTAHSKEPDYDVNCTAEFPGISTLLVFDCNPSKKLEAYVKIENGANTDRPEESDEKRLPQLFNLMDLFMHE